MFPLVVVLQPKLTFNVSMLTCTQLFIVYLSWAWPIQFKTWLRLWLNLLEMNPCVNYSLSKWWPFFFLHLAILRTDGKILPILREVSQVTLYQLCHNHSPWLILFLIKNGASVINSTGQIALLRARWKWGISCSTILPHNNFWDLVPPCSLRGLKMRTNIS